MQIRPHHLRGKRWLTVLPAALVAAALAACGGNGATSPAPLAFTQAPPGSFLPPELPSGYTVKENFLKPEGSSGGITTLQTLSVLQNFKVRRFAPNSVDAVHLISEAYRLAYADRAKYIADSDCVPVPTAGLLDAGYLKNRSALIRMDRTMGVPIAGTPAGATAAGVDQSLSLPSTSHRSIVDRNGNAVSMTTAIENGFGSLQMVGGFLLNNQLTDFSFTPTDAQGNPVVNRVEPGKRPRSSMAPTIVFDARNELDAIVGSPGGSSIIQFVTKTLVGVIDWDLNIQQASNLPNFGAQTTGTTMLEARTAVADTADGLRARGRTVSVADINSGVHGDRVEAPSLDFGPSIHGKTEHGRRFH